jgi:hypothetical protein
MVVCKCLACYRAHPIYSTGCPRAAEQNVVPRSREVSARRAALYPRELASIGVIHDVGFGPVSRMATGTDTRSLQPSAASSCKLNTIPLRHPPLLPPALLFPLTSFPMRGARPT